MNSDDKIVRDVAHKSDTYEFLNENNLLQIDDSDIPTSIRSKYVSEPEYDCNELP